MNISIVEGVRVVSMAGSSLKIERPGRKAVISGYVFDEPTLTVRELRSWPDDKLHIISTKVEMGASARSMIVAEMCRRRAWKEPAGPAFWVSCGAFIVSVASMVISLLR